MTGWLRRDATGDSTAVTDQSTRAISSDRIGDALGREVLRRVRRPAQPRTPHRSRRWPPPELPDLDNGPHFFYGLQWWFFGLLALFGFGYLAWDERRGSPRRRGDRATTIRTCASSRRRPAP